MLSPWKNTALLKPNNSNQLRYDVKHMLKKHRYLKGLLTIFFILLKR